MHPGPRLDVWPSDPWFILPLARTQRPLPDLKPQSCIARESKTAHVAALRHALVKLEAAAARGGQQRETEVTDLWVLHREFVEDAVVCSMRKPDATLETV